MGPIFFSLERESSSMRKGSSLGLWIYLWVFLSNPMTVDIVSPLVVVLGPFHHCQSGPTHQIHPNPMTVYIVSISGSDSRAHLPLPEGARTQGCAHYYLPIPG
jgi:hypothetical protein